MNLFYTTEVRDGYFELFDEEARHAVQVLRKGEGDPLTAVDGRGGWYEGVIVETAKKRCVVRIARQQLDTGRRPFHLHLAVAPTKNVNRFEWFLEKATEIGVEEITPLLCFHSERRHLRADRLEKVLVAAMKQSLKAYKPRLNALIKFSEFIDRKGAGEERFIAYLGDRTIGHLKDNYRPGKNVTILIGPEGDFSDQEVELALEKRFQAVTLGPSRLRTETAGIAACHTVQLMNS